MNKSILIIFGIIIVFGVGAFIGLKSAKPGVQTDRQIVDSVNNVWRHREINLSDSLKKSYLVIATNASNKADIATEKAKKERIKSNKLQAKLDSLQNNGAECPEVLTTCLETNNYLRSEINLKDTIITELNIEAESYSKALNECENQRTIEEAILSDFKRSKSESDSLLVIEKKAVHKERKRTKAAIFIGKVTTTLSAVISVVATLYLTR
jgi:uncharacterized coiled-coil DUF342 family protein